MKAESDNPDTLAMVDQSKTNHPKTDPNIDKSTFKCTHCNKTGHTKSRCFEIVGYPDWWDHNHDQQKKDSKKTSTAVVAEIKTEANVAEKASALVPTTDYGDRSHPLNLPHKKLFPQPMDIQTRQTIGCGIKQGKLYYLDLQSKDSNKLRQALMADGFEGEKKNTIEPSPPSEQFESKDVFTEIPNQSSSVKGVLNLEPDPFMKRLPHRHNRGIPKPTYKPELSTKVKYPMSNYVFNHRLFESNKSFVNQLSTVSIPNSVQEALADPRWKATMNEEMKSL
ncbi:hypothetical protein AAG906_019632 [Vitis piasezkii]